MFKMLLRNTGIYAVSLFLLPRVVSGVKIFGGYQTMIIGAFVLTLIFVFLKPVFNILTFPFNFLTLGLFSVVTNAVVLYLLTVFVPNIMINAFYFPGASLAGFTISPMEINILFAFILSSIILSFISGVIRWLIK